MPPGQLRRQDPDVTGPARRARVEVTVPDNEDVHRVWIEQNRCWPYIEMQWNDDPRMPGPRHIIWLHGDVRCALYANTRSPTELEKVLGSKLVIDAAALPPRGFRVVAISGPEPVTWTFRRVDVAGDVWPDGVWSADLSTTEWTYLRLTKHVRMFLELRDALSAVSTEPVPVSPAVLPA